MEQSMQASVTRAVEQVVRGNHVFRADEHFPGHKGEAIEKRADMILSTGDFDINIPMGVIKTMVKRAIHRDLVPLEDTGILRLLIYRQAAQELEMECGIFYNEFNELTRLLRDSLSIV